MRRSRFHEVWYGWQTLTVDAFAVGVLQLGVPFHREDEFALTSIGVYALGPSLVHLAHGAVGKGLLSILLRIALPAAGYGLGYVASGGSTGDGSSMRNGEICAFVGGASAAAFDAAVLGWDRWQGPRGAGLAYFGLGNSF